VFGKEESNYNTGQFIHILDSTATVQTERVPCMLISSNTGIRKTVTATSKYQSCDTFGLHRFYVSSRNILFV
jgi:hypothetical protein